MEYFVMFKVAHDVVSISNPMHVHQPPKENLWAANRPRILFSQPGVVGTMVCFSGGCTTNVDALVLILVTNDDLGGGGFLVLCLGMVNSLLLAPC